MRRLSASGTGMSRIRTDAAESVQGGVRWEQEALRSVDHFRTVSSLLFAVPIVFNFRLLCEIAKICVQNSETKEQCLQELEKLVTYNISCDVLVLQLQDKPYVIGFLENYAGYGHIYFHSMPIPPSDALPLEVIDRMITEWKVKSLKLEFHYTNREPVFSKVWSEKKLFTEIYMDQDIRTVRLFEHHLEKVEIDLSDSLMSPFPVDDFGESQCSQGFQEEHLVGNIRKLFPTKKYSVITNREFGCKFNNVEECFTSLLNAVWTDGSRNIELSIHYFVSVFRKEPLKNPRVPSSFKNRPLRHLSDAVATSFDITYWIGEFNTDSYIGRRFELKDELTGCTFKANVFTSPRSFSWWHFEELYSREVQPTGSGDRNSLWPLVSDACDTIKESMMANSRSSRRPLLQGPLRRPRQL